MVELFSSWIVSPPYPNTFNVGISMHIVLMGFSQSQKRHCLQYFVNEHF
jgi:hypothetical protein